MVRADQLPRAVVHTALLVHGEVSVVEVAGASLEANFSHAVVNQKEIPQISQLLIGIHRDSVCGSPLASLNATTESRAANR